MLNMDRHINPGKDNYIVSVQYAGIYIRIGSPSNYEEDFFKLYSISTQLMLYMNRYRNPGNDNYIVSGQYSGSNIMV